MKELQLKYSPYLLKLKKPFSTAKGKIEERKGFLISLKNAEGVEGLGDASPFPEFGTETYEECETALKNLSFKIKVDFTNIEESVNELLNDLNGTPALRYGTEQALINLICKEKNSTIDELLNLTLKKQIPVNGVIGFTDEKHSVLLASSLINDGFSAIKIKTGRDDFREDFEILKSLRNEIDDKIKLRIDANGKWNVKQAVNNLNELEHLNIEYAEQPVKTLNEFIELKEKVKIPLAADESVRNIKEAEEFILNKAADYLILKPMVIGGLIPTIQIIKKAEANYIKPVITSSFESAIGRTNAVIAAATVKTNIAHGLAVQHYFDKDLIENPFPVKRGMIHL